MVVEYTLRAAVKVDGRQLSPELEPLLEQVIVDRSLHLPSMFTITLLDPGRDVLTKSGIRYGSKVEISGTPLGGQVDTPLITGEVQIIQADYLGSHGARIVVTGFDPAYKLMRGTRSRTYMDMTDSEICRQVVSGAGIEIGDIEATSKTYHHVYQHNTSDWNFLHARAERIGYEIGVEEEKFFFRKPVASSGAPGEGNLHTDNPLQLVIGKGLLEFHGRVSGSGQVAQVEVRGYDSEHKKAIVSSAKAGTISADLASVSPQTLAGNGDSKYVSVDHHVEDASDADAVAQALAERISSSFAEVEGIARGNPQLNAGTPVSISGVADMFAGRYVLTRTRQVFDKDGYRTHFEVSGRQQRSLLGLVTRGAAAAAVAPTATASAATTGSPRFYGAFRGIVTANEDPLKEGRVKLQLPQVFGDQESDWAPVAQLGAGPNSGAVFIPEVNDEVLVTFEAGDPSRPFVIGGLYNGMDKPSLGNGLFSNGKVLRRGFVSRKGHRLVFFDDDHDSGIALLTADDQVRVALKETDKQLHLFCNGDVEIEAGGNVTVKASKELKVTSGTSLTIESQTNLTLTGHAGVKVESDAAVEIKGAIIKLN
jgi:phage protein D